MLKRILLFTLVVFFVVQVNVFAAVNLIFYSGSIQITEPDGTVIVVTASQTLPEIPEGSEIQVLDGKVFIAVKDGSSYVDVSFGSYSVRLVNGVSANVGFVNGEPVIEVTEGAVKLIMRNGSMIDIDAGDEVKLPLSGADADIEVLKGSVVLTDLNGQMTTIDSKVQVVPVETGRGSMVDQVIDDVADEESARDISPTN